MSLTLFTPIVTPKAVGPPFEFLTGGSSPLGGLGAHYWEDAQQLANGVRVGSERMYPAVSLYRHAVELHIKKILLGFGEHQRLGARAILLRLGVRLGFRAQQVFDEPLRKQWCDHVLKRGHDLRSLLKDLRQVVAAYDLALTPELIKTIKMLHKEDPNGTTFRYERRRDGSRVRIADGKEWDARRFMDSIESVLDELSEIMRDLTEIEVSAYLSELEQGPGFVPDRREALTDPAA
jgi:hypothetical protein